MISSAQIDIDQSLRILFISFLFITIVTNIIHYFTKDWHYTYFITLMMPVAFIVYRSLYGFLKVKFLHQATSLGLALILLLVVCQT